ncbi:MAG: hypothetical protein RLY23_167 [Actinomycetota bacterium]|jgi:hypothetical protein
MALRARMGVTYGAGVGDLAKNYYSRWAAIDAECAACADVFVDDECNGVSRILTWEFGSDCLGNCIYRDHMDAFPWADVYAALAHDALRLINVQKLFWLYRCQEVTRVDLLEQIVG